MYNYWHDNNLTLKQKLKIDLRIADYEAGYPVGEAAFDTIEDWEKCTGESFEYKLKILTLAGDGAY